MGGALGEGGRSMCFYTPVKGAGTKYSTELLPNHPRKMTLGEGAVLDWRVRGQTGTATVESSDLRVQQKQANFRLSL